MHSQKKQYHKGCNISPQPSYLYIPNIQSYSDCRICIIICCVLREREISRNIVLVIIYIFFKRNVVLALIQPLRQENNKDKRITKQKKSSEFERMRRSTQIMCGMNLMADLKTIFSPLLLSFSFQLRENLSVVSDFIWISEEEWG